MVADALTPLEVWSLTPSPIDIEALPPEETSIDRPRAGAEHRHTNGEDREEDVNPRVLPDWRIERQRNPDLVQGSEGSHYRRPQTCKQKDSPYSRNGFLSRGDRLRRRSRETGDREVD
jgi:hypothetical protein